LARHIREAPVIVSVKAIRRRRKLLRTAVDLKVSGEAGTFLLGVVAKIVHYIEIQISIPVIVQEGPADAPGRVLRAHCHSLEAPTALIAKEDVRSVVQKIEVQIAVAVRISSGHSHTVAVVSSSGSLRTVLESTVSPIQIEPIARLLRR